MLTGVYRGKFYLVGKKRILDFRWRDFKFSQSFPYGLLANGSVLDWPKNGIMPVFFALCQ
jgi:hypothetical protein